MDDFIIRSDLKSRQRQVVLDWELKYVFGSRVLNLADVIELDLDLCDRADDSDFWHDSVKLNYLFNFVRIGVEKTKLTAAWPIASLVKLAPSELDRTWALRAYG